MKHALLRVLLVGAALTGLTVTACIKNPMVPEDPDEPSDEVPGDSSATSISDSSSDELPPVRFVRPDDR